MTAEEFDNLRIGDKVITRNGRYVQHGTVIDKQRDRKMRWITYEWTNPRGQTLIASKRYLSVYFT